MPSPGPVFGLARKTGRWQDQPRNRFKILLTVLGCRFQLFGQILSAWHSPKREEWLTSSPTCRANNVAASSIFFELLLGDIARCSTCYPYSVQRSERTIALGRWELAQRSPGCWSWCCKKDLEERKSFALKLAKWLSFAWTCLPNIVNQLPYSLWSHERLTFETSIVPKRRVHGFGTPITRLASRPAHSSSLAKTAFNLLDHRRIDPWRTKHFAIPSTPDPSLRWKVNSLLSSPIRLSCMGMGFRIFIKPFCKTNKDAWEKSSKSHWRISARLMNKDIHF